MDVAIVDTGDMPEGTIISFHTGSIRRHVTLEKDKSVSLSHAVGTAPIRVDLMAELGRHSFTMMDNQEVYDVPIASGAEEVRMKFRIRDASTVPKAEHGAGAGAGAGEEGGGVDLSSPSKKLHTALMMRSYLDNHDVLRQMQDLLQDMVTRRPADPIEYMIRRLEDISQQNHSMSFDAADDFSGNIVRDDCGKAVASSGGKASADAEADASEEEDDDEDAPDMPPLPVHRGPRQSVSAEAYGEYNVRKAYEKKVVPKDVGAKLRIRDVLKESWMFKEYSTEDINIIIDALSEKHAAAGDKLVQQGESGEMMWVIEDGELECFKTIKGAEKLVKTCRRGDVFGELALLYNCPRAASVVAKTACHLWELDRETFVAICFEAAQKQGVEYKGFKAPGASGANQEDEEESEEEDDEDAPDMPELPPPNAHRGPRQSVSAEAYGNFNVRKSYEAKVILKDGGQKLRIKEILSECWMFKSYSEENMAIIIDALSEKSAAAGEGLVRQGDEGSCMWIIEDGTLECSKLVNGEEKVVKVCKRCDIFGELALLYNCPRAATVKATEACKLWELDRETFVAICYEAAQKQGVEYEGFSAPGVSTGAPAEKKEGEDADASEEEEDDEDAPDMPPPPVHRGPRQSVSAEAYGDFNVRKAYEKKVIAKDEMQKSRIREVLKECWMFKDYSEENLTIIIDALSEKVAATDEVLVRQGDEGSCMWIIEDGRLECTKPIGGEEKIVKVCKRCDIFGELALLYNCPRAATVKATEPCKLWELDRETFVAICYEAAQKQGVEYEGFSAPGATSATEQNGSSAKDTGGEAEESEDDDDDEEAPDMPPPPAAHRGPRQSVSAEAYGEFNVRKAYEKKVVPKDVGAKLRIKDVLKESWMFKEYSTEDINIIIDALSERHAASGDKLVQQGESGDIMWVIEDGELECFKTIKGAEKLVKTCSRGDVFGELALLYNCPRAASVVAKTACHLWELDRETFTAICFEAAQKQGVEYKGFKAPGASAEEGNEEESEEEDDTADAEDLPLPPANMKRGQRQSVSAEAYGEFNKRKSYEKKVIMKDDAQKQRIKEILSECWMFKAYTEENMTIIIDALSEKSAAADEVLVRAGDEGSCMWIIENGTLECSKLMDGVEKVVKVCKRCDIFGELALLYNCPRAATVKATEPCKLWELDRETFVAICHETAQKQGVDYEGFSAPGASNAATADEVNDDADNVSEGEEPQTGRKSEGGRKRREGVSAEAMKEDGEYVPPVHKKSEDERTQLKDIIQTSPDGKLHMLFGNVSKDTFEKIIDAMFLKSMEAGQNAIEQGAQGDYFYIVKSGHFDIFVSKDSQPPTKVFEAGPGFAFGELALLYNAPRTATITASEASEVWLLERAAFQNLVVQSSKIKFQQHVGFLSNVDIFSELSPNERCSLAEVLQEEEFEDDEAILEQGEKDDKMFIIQEGSAVACIKGDQGEVEVMQYGKADYFGEIALLLGEPRKASVYAVGNCTCLYITRDAFQRVVGPLTDLLSRNLGKYAKYQDAIAKAEDEAVLEMQLRPEVRGSVRGSVAECGEDGTEVANIGATPASKVVHRKRAKKDTAVVCETKTVEKEIPAEGESLKDKVHEDFKNSKLVEPTKEFENDDCAVSLYGGLMLDQRFTDNKKIHKAGKQSFAEEGDDDVVCWTGETKLKKNTDIAVICQKGHKSAFDPTPNQDNYFVQEVGDVYMYGICDGHGPFGHLVSFRLVQTLPKFLSSSVHFRKDWAAALKEAFLKAHDDLVQFCDAEGINIQASGAAGSVLVHHEQTVHVAFIGDARILLGSWNRRDSRMVFCSGGHTPDVPEERARLEAAGSEVREVNPDNYRIYRPGTNFPGLTMSRAFGDTACEGVLREPEYHMYRMQPTDEWFAIVASDGIWEFIKGEEAQNMTAKKLRLKGPRETVDFLVNASRKRWSHVCGDYCDDITCILVQWNSAAAFENGNHRLRVPRPTVPE